MKKTSADYGVQIYSICRILFKEVSVQSKLNKYKLVIELNEKNEKMEMLKAKLTELQGGKNNSKGDVYKMIMATGISLIGALVCCFFFFSIDEEMLFTSGENLFFMLVIVLVSILIGYFCQVLLEMIKKRQNSYKLVDMYRKQIESVQNKIQELQMQYKQFDVIEKK